MRVNDLTGRRFGRLYVIERAGSNKKGRALWKCKCDCGNIKITDGTHLLTGDTVSCGCKQKEGNAQDLSGKRYGRLTVIKRAENRGEKVAWVCKCDCGKDTIVTTDLLKSGRTKSCGCYSRECVSKRRNKGYGRRLINTYNHMKQRCYNENDAGYPNYGGRGISVCKEWRENPDSFYKWAIKNGYKDNLTIDRIDVNGNYEPNNCRWETIETQANNRRNNIIVEHNGEKKTLRQWSKYYDVDYEKLRVLYHKIGFERALNDLIGEFNG